MRKKRWTALNKAHLVLDSRVSMKIIDALVCVVLFNHAFKYNNCQMKQLICEANT